MTAHKECVSCRHLGRCRTVDPPMLWSHGSCHDWNPIADEEVQGRIEAINDFGEAAVVALVKIKEE